MTKHLWDRLVDAKHTVVMQQSRYRVVFEDLDQAHAKILIPDPNFLGAALTGGILVDVENYELDRQKMQAWLDAGNDPSEFSWDKVGGALHPYADPIEAMTEEEAIEYLIIKDLPPHVRNQGKRNAPSYVVTEVSNVPWNRLHRNVWEFCPEPDEPIVVDIDAAKALQKRNMVEYFVRSNRRLEELKPFARFDEAAKRECASLAALNPALLFDRLDRAKTLGDLEMAIPAPLLIELGVK